MNWPRSIPDYQYPALAGIKSRLASLARTILFHIAYAAGLLASRLRTHRKKILILRTDGLGDCVLSEPFIRAIANRYRDAQIHLWAPAPTCELFAAAEYVHERKIIPRGFKAGCLDYFHSATWHRKMAWSFGANQFDLAIYPATSAEPFGNWILSSVRAKKRWVVDGDLFHQFDWQRSKTLRRASRILAKPKAVHELIANADLARQCGASEIGPFPKISISAAANEMATQLVCQWRTRAQTGGAAGILGVVIAGSMGNFAWPANKWQSALQHIWMAHRLMPVFLSPPVRLNSAIPFAELNHPVDVLTLAALLREMDLVLSLDTGPAHIAAAMGTPTIVLSNGGHPARFFPWPDAPWIKTLVHPMPCQGCVCRCTLAEVECLTRINVTDVVAAVSDLRNRSACAA